MPFGIFNSQATFKRMMDNALEGVERAESYVDDRCVFSTAFEQHLSDLQKAFDRIRGANVRLRRNKYHFGYEQGIFSGLHVSVEGRRHVQPRIEKLSYFLNRNQCANCFDFWGA